jgi:hypothetical protein
VVSRARRVNGTLGARPRCNPGQAAFGVRGTGYAGGTEPVFSIAILMTMNTPRLLSRNGRVYLRAWDEFDRHSVVLRQADMPGMDYAGFKAIGLTADLVKPHPIDVVRERSLPGACRGACLRLGVNSRRVPRLHRQDRSLFPIALFRGDKAS